MNATACAPDDVCLKQGRFQFDWERHRDNVKKLQVRIVKAQQEGRFHTSAVPVDSKRRINFELLERNAVKVARSVLRGVGSGDEARLPDGAVWYFVDDK